MIRRPISDFDCKLLSVLVELRATNKCIIYGSLGIPIHGWFFNLIEKYDPVYSKKLHDNSNEKPFTLSTLIDHEGMPLGPGRKLGAGDKCWIRITTFSQKMSSLIEEKILPSFRKMDSCLSLYKMDFQIYDFSTNPYTHPLANQTTFIDIVKNEKYKNPKKVFHFNFITPTAFRSGSGLGSLDVPLPIPDLVFNSYIKKWNVNCPNEEWHFQKDWAEFLRSSVKIIQIYSLQTMDWKTPAGKQKDRVIPGFTGKISFDLSKRLKLENKSSFWRDNYAVMHALSDFAFYCGTGQHATVGMGQTITLDR